MQFITFLRVLLAIWFVIAPVKAFAASLPLLLGGATSVGPPTLTFIGNATGTHSGAVETYTSYSIGTASGFTTRRIIFCLYNNNVAPTSISSISINSGAITPTIHLQVSQAASGPFSSIFSADIPTGTTATIAVTFASNIFSDQQLAAYSVDDALMNSTTPNTGSVTTAGATSVTTTSFNQGAGGFTIACGGLGTNGSGSAITGYTTDAFGGSTNVIGAHLSPISSSGSASAAWSYTTNTTAALAAASWR
jgi:hypothetical protein